MYYSAYQQELTSLKNREEVKKAITSKLPYYKLIHRIRIHDFHRFGCLPPSQKYKTAFYGVPVALTANKGSAVIVFTTQGPKLTVTGNSSIKGDRPLLTENGICFSIGNKKPIPLDKILDEFLSAVPKVIAEFESYHQRK